MPSPALAVREVLLSVGILSLTIRLHETSTAQRIWTALPLFSTAETWGDTIHFELPIKTGRERNARLNVVPGDICYWTDESRVFIGWGPTPISMSHEIRLMRPCNVWATALGDVRALETITPGEKITMHAVGLTRPLPVVE